MEARSRIYGIIICALLCTQSVDAQIYITEFQASNLSTVLSPDGNYLEWIELYNSSGSWINLEGYFLTDDFQIPDKVQIENLTIAPGSYKLIWLDDLEKTGYCDLNLNMGGEELALFTPGGVLMDSVSFGRQFMDVSYGRYPSTWDHWFYFEDPTPGGSNHGDGMDHPVQSAEVTFSVPGGFYEGSLEIYLTADPNEGIIRYTTDGSWPVETSQRYTSSIVITETTVIRARLFESGRLPGRTVTNTYILNDVTTVPVVSISANPNDLWDGGRGIYVEGYNGSIGLCFDRPANWNNDWERPINFEYFTTEGVQEINQLAGTKIAGGCSRAKPFKSMGIFAREKYGDDRLSYRFFRSKDVDEFKSILIRNAGNDSWSSMMRDGFIQTLLSDQFDIDYQAYQPSIVYLNGEYWGILSVREKVNEHYPASNYNLDSDDIQLMEAGSTSRPCWIM
jgi:hypothetical protein